MIHSASVAVLEEELMQEPWEEEEGELNIEGNSENNGKYPDRYSRLTLLQMINMLEG